MKKVAQAHLQRGYLIIQVMPVIIVKYFQLLEMYVGYFTKQQLET